MKLTKKDYLWSYLGVFLALSANVVMTPFVMYFLDGDSFGLWGIFQSLAAITVLFDFGFSTTFARNINYCWSGAKTLEKTGTKYYTTSEPNYYLMKKTMTACKIVFLIISIIALFLLLTIGTFYISFISSDINRYESVAAWLIYAAAIFLNLYFGYFGSFLKGVGAISDVNKVTVISKLVQILATFIFLLCGYGLIGTALAYLAYGTLFRCLAKRRFYLYRGIGTGLKSINIRIPVKEVKDMFFIVWHNAWREGLVSLSNYFANQACTIICSLYMPLTQTGAYSLAVQLATAVSQVSAAMYSANQPVLQSAYINNKKIKVQKTMSLIICSFVFMNMIGLLAVEVIGLPILRIIKPDAVVSAGVMLGIGFYQFMLKFRNCYTSYFSCTNRILYVKAFIISAFLCVVISFITMGILKWGVWGLIVSQIISQGVFNIWYWPVKANQEMQLSIKQTLILGWEECSQILKSIYRKRKNIE